MSRSRSLSAATLRTAAFSAARCASSSSATRSSISSRCRTSSSESWPTSRASFHRAGHRGLGTRTREIPAVRQQIGLEGLQPCLFLGIVTFVGARPRVELPFEFAREKEVQFLLFHLVRLVPVAQRDGELRVVVELAFLLFLFQMKRLMHHVLGETCVVVCGERPQGLGVSRVLRGQGALVTRGERLLQRPSVRGVRVLAFPEGVGHEIPMLVILFKTSDVSG